MPNSNIERLESLLRKDRLRILVVVRDHMSGLLYAVPYLRALRQKFPNSEIMLLANHFAIPIIKDCPYIDKIIPFYQFREDELWHHKFELILQKTRAFVNLYQRVDLVLHMRFVGAKTLAFCRMLGKPFQVGYVQGKSDHFLDINVGKEDTSLDSRTRNAKILNAIGIDAPSHEMEIWIPNSDTDWITKWLNAQGWREEVPLIAFHPGCHWGCNEWLVEYWSDLGNELQKRFPCKLVITGTASERPLAEQIARGLASPPIIASGETTLIQFAALLRKTMAVVSVDTAPTQICQALKKPSVILMGAGNPAWNGPLAGEPMILLQKLKPTENAVEHCNFGAGICHSASCSSRLTNIRVADVLDALEHVIVHHPEALKAEVRLPLLEPAGEFR